MTAVLKASSRLEIAKNVGAHRPTKIPKRSACALDSAASPPVRNQIAIDPIMDAKPRTKHNTERFLASEVFIEDQYLDLERWNVPGERASV